jgi:hypothetical protein
MVMNLVDDRRLSAAFLEDIGSALEGGAKRCQRLLVNELLGLLVRGGALDSGQEGATPNQRALQGGFLVRI